MKTHRVFQVDSFTDQPFQGNPAGVMLLDTSLSAETMQKVAMEMNLSETAFLSMEEDHVGIRFFTPAQEVPICGHAALASAHVLYELGLKQPNEKIILRAMAGDLTISRHDDGIAMNFPQYPIELREIPVGFAGMVGFEPVEMYNSLHNWVVAVASNEEIISQARPDFSAMNRHGLGHLMITAQSERPGIDFVSRCFAPSLGIDEDPVTGSAHCALAPLWSEKLGKQQMRALQVSARTGELQLKMKDGRVEIKGVAVTVFEAELKI